jgi:hypothetical protein
MIADAGTGAGAGGEPNHEDLDRELGYLRDQIHELISIRDRRPLLREERDRYDELTQREKSLIAARRQKRTEDG